MVAPARPAPARAATTRSAPVDAAVLPTKERPGYKEADLARQRAKGSRGQSTAWTNGYTTQSQGALVGACLLPYEASESCCLCMRCVGDTQARFVTARLGPVQADGTIARSDSIKVSGEWRGGTDLEWVVRGAPLREMSAKSPMGLVGCRFKMWVQNRFSRRWVGRSAVFAVPAPAHALSVADLEIVVATKRGVAADAAASQGARIIDAGFPAVAPQQAPRSPSAETLGREILRAVVQRQWGVATALLCELRLSPEAARLTAMAEVDGTRRTALRLCVDGQREDRPPLLQALERGMLTALLGAKRPYWWTMRITTVCHRTLSFLGEVWIGMPRPSSYPGTTSRPWSAPGGVPAWDECRWSEPQACNGYLEECGVDASPSQVGRLRMGDETDLVLRLTEPGEAVALGPGSFRNPLGLPLLAAHGRIANTLASGVFDPRVCTRLAAELEACGPCEAAALATACGADPRALADDGLSPYTAALLGEDPCGLLSGLDATLRARILRGDALAWAEAGRSRAGAGHVDMVAAPLTRGLAVPDDFAQNLFEYCFRADLPLLAVRALTRVDGQRYLLATMERARDPHWFRVAERILQQTTTGTPLWCSKETLMHALTQIRQGRLQFKLLLSAFLARFRHDEDDSYTHPSTLSGSTGAECPICFEPLCRSTPIAFVDEDSHAICPHFLCSSCARGYTASASSSGAWLKCPECRRSAPKVLPLPRLADDPSGWFDFLAAPSGVMARATLLRAVSAMLPVDADKLGSLLDAGLLSSSPVGHEVTAAEFLTGGLYAWVWRHEEEYRLSAGLGPLPDLTDRAEWFKYWNLSRTGFLTRGEVLRAILRAFGVSSLDRERVDELRRRVDQVWDCCTTDRKRRDGRCNPHSVTLADFADDGGLGDLLEEAFGMDFTEGGLHPMPPVEEVVGPKTGLGRDGCRPCGPLWPRPGAALRRERVAASARAVMSEQPAPASRGPTRTAATPAAGAGVLDLLEPSLTTTSGNAAGGVAVPHAAIPHVAVSAVGIPGASEAPPNFSNSLDPMEALEALETDLAGASDNSDSRANIISL